MVTIKNTPEIYVQGFSTGLPENLQLQLLRLISRIVLETKTNFMLKSWQQSRAGFKYMTR